MHSCNILIISIGLLPVIDSVVQWLRRPFDHFYLETLVLSSIPNEGIFFLCFSFFFFFFFLSSFFSFLLFLLF